MKQNKLNKNSQYWAQISVTDDNKVKIKKAQQLVTLNQFSKKWKTIDSREFSRCINKSTFIIK
jgi:hypothetical protein